MTDNQKWEHCDKPKLGDILRWKEPIWAEPSKPRGKRDQIGEQEIVAELINRTDFLEFKVISIQKISSGNEPLKVAIDDIIKRKKSSLEKGNCHRVVKD